MPLQVIPAEESDLPRVVAIEAIAFANNPISPILFTPDPNAPSTTTITTPAKEGGEEDAHVGEEDPDNLRVQQLIHHRQADPSCHWMKVIDTEIDPGTSGTDNLVAFSIWYIWDKADTPSPRLKPQHWGPGDNGEACEAFFGGMRNKLNARYEGKPVLCKFNNTHHPFICSPFSSE